MKYIQPDKIVQRTVELLEYNTETESSIIEKIEAEFRITKNDAEGVFELTNTGIFRAHIILAGQQYPKNNLNDHPIIKAAIKIYLEKTGGAALAIKLYAEKKSWWKIWKRND